MTEPTPTWDPDEQPTRQTSPDGPKSPYAHTDLGNAERLRYWEGDRIRYVPGLGWHVYDRTRWRQDTDGAVHRLAQGVAKDMVKEAFHLQKDGQEDEGKKLLKHAMASQAAGRLDAMVRVAQTQEHLVAQHEQLDADPDLLNVRNGTLHLPTGELRPHDARDLITRRAGVEYDPDAQAPRFKEFLAETFQDPELAAYVQRVAGYTLTGHQTEQVLFLHHGAGLNGKSTLLELFAHLMGDYARAVDTSSLTNPGHQAGGRAGAARPDLIRLRGARYVRGSEIERGAYLAENVIKQLTGDDMIAARRLYQDEVEFLFHGKLWLAVNDLPNLLSTGHAIWRRLKVIPYLHRVDRVDRTLGRTLKREMPGVLNWALEGHAAWARDGLGNVRAVSEAVSAYRNEQDPIVAFVAERCERDADYTEPLAALHDAYKTWCKDQEIQTVLPKRQFGSRLSDQGYHPARGTANVAVRRGVRLRRPRPVEGRPQTFGEFMHEQEA